MCVWLITGKMRNTSLADSIREKKWKQLKKNEGMQWSVVPMTYDQSSKQQTTRFCRKEKNISQLQLLKRQKNTFTMNSSLKNSE